MTLVSTLGTIGFEAELARPICSYEMLPWIGSMTGKVCIGRGLVGTTKWRSAPHACSSSPAPGRPNAAQEGTMGRINWRRVVLCGLLTGVVWGVLYAIALPLVLVERHDISPSLPVTTLDEPGSSTGLRAVVVIMPLVLGISTIWLYAAIRPRYGPGPKTAALAGVAVWFFGSWVDATWAVFKGVRLGAFVGPAAVSLPIVLVAAVVGAWLYKE